MSAMQDLDVFNCPLDGIRLIEASAGTGKTWNISALYVRLLLEKPLTVEQILVVTFTKAATAELRERIRARLASLVRVLEHAAQADSHDVPPDLSDPMVAGLFEHVIGAQRIAPGDALRRLQLALLAFDQAAIHTIHGFCQRALGETPFAAGLPFALELTPDDSGVQHELAVDFWQRAVERDAARYAGFAAWLVDRNITPATLCAHLARRLKKPMAELRWPPPLTDDGDDALVTGYARAQAEWQASADDIMQRLHQALTGLNGRSYSDVKLMQARQAWDTYLAANNPAAALDAKADLLATAKLTKNTKKGGTAPTHPFFDLAETLIAVRDAEVERHERRWLALLDDWLTWAPDALHERKRQLRVASYDDLLGNLHRALRSHAWLAEVLRERYPCALIDEFQDTDPLQFDIFNHIYGQPSQHGNGDGEAQRGPLFLVGDPKQAIYSFRAADLHTYLAARDAADASYTLGVNQRSTAEVIAAGNRLFGGNQQAFVLPGLDYPPVRPGTRERPTLVDDVSAAGFNIWLLPDEGERLSKGEAQQRAAAAAAAEIARLLGGAVQQRVLLGDKSLAPGDIAVIVQTHVQGSLVKRVLASFGIGSVELTQDSVFAGEEAETLERVLQAIETPGDVRLLRAALATEFFGLDAAALYRLQSADSPDAEAVSWIERMQRYRHLWLERGFAPMWRTLLHELNLPARWVAGPDGERRLTNYMHLAELVQARWAAQPGAAALLRWVASQRQTEGGGEEAQLRLESDQNLVQIVTVHKSKGLEYAVVFCPFLWDGRLRDAGGGDGIEFHDTRHNGCAVIDYTRDANELAAAQDAVRCEQAAEQVRLLYVALTRAVYRCYCVAGVYTSKRSAKESCAGMLNWLIAGQGRSFAAWTKGDTEPRDILAAWKALAGVGIAISPLPKSTEAPHRLAPAETAALALTANQATRTTHEMWRIASFSGLVAHVGHGRSEAADERSAQMPARPDYDALAGQAATLAHDDSSTAIEMTAINADDILRFPRGPAAGECLHRAFELADFSEQASWQSAVERALEERPPAEASPDHRRWPSMMQRMLSDTLSCEIRPGLRLQHIGKAQRLTELEFTYPVGSFALPALRRLLHDAGYPDLALDTGVLRGYMKGFIDLVFRHDDRWWIVDWKSNHLGDSPQDYARSALQIAMTQHGYHLQYLLYTLALHRYLRLRRADYDYERDMGGSAYLFVRGVRPGWRDGEGAAGVYFDRPPKALIEALDTLMQPRLDEGVASIMGDA